MNIETRTARITDLPVVARLFDAYRQFYEQPADPALAETFIRERLQREDSVIILAVDVAGQVVGFCQLYPTFCSIEAKPIYSLSDLFISPDVRRKLLCSSRAGEDGAYDRTNK